MEIILKKGGVVADNLLHLNDAIKQTNYMLKFIYITVGLGMIGSGFNVYKNVSKPLTLFFIAISIYSFILLYLIFKRSTAAEINFEEIKKINLKKTWNIGTVLRLDLSNGKTRFISNFKNDEDAEQLYHFIESKINPTL